MSPPASPSWAFGPFLLDGSQHLLFRDGELVPLSRRAVDILTVLLESHGQLVEKEALMRRVWPDSFVEESNLAVHISQLRKVLSDPAGSHRIETIPRRGYRFTGPIAPGLMTEKAQEYPSNSLDRDPESLASPSADPADAGVRTPARIHYWPFIAGGLVLLIALVVVGFIRERSRTPAAAVTGQPAPLKTDSIVLADISNNTGDPVFNTTLRQAMSIELEQSPYLHLLPESRIQQTLRLMGKQPGDVLTPVISREVCQRTGSEAVVDGWIAKLGSEYVLGIRAINCRSGDHIAELQKTAGSKEQVLKALGDGTGELRSRLGESLSTVQRFDTPIEDATTPSLDALQAYSLGKAMMIQRGESASCVPLFQRAIRLDPDFAMAYAALGTAYSNLGEVGLAATNIRRAYSLRQRVSERERLYLESHYYTMVTGDLPKAIAIYQTWSTTYPLDVVPRTNLTMIHAELGQFEASLEQARELVRIAPDDSENYGNLANAYLLLEREKDARATVDAAIARGFDSSDLHLYLFDLAFLDQDGAGMEKQLAWAAGEPGIDDLLLDRYAAALAFSGQNAKAREFTERATDAARRADQKETAAGYQVEAAQREALFGDVSESKRRAEAALQLAQDRDTKFGAAIALALAGSSQQSEAIAVQLTNDFPDDTIVQSEYLPSLRGAVALARKDPSGAIHELEVASPFELGVSAGFFPVYVRGLAFLAAGDGRSAEREFEKLIAHPGALISSPLGPMAHLQCARAYELQGNHERAKAMYQEFLGKWKNADSDLPILQTVKVEVAGLSHSSGQ